MLAIVPGITSALQVSASPRAAFPRLVRYRLEPGGSARQSEARVLAGVVHYVATIRAVATYYGHNVAELGEAGSAGPDDAELVARFRGLEINHWSGPPKARASNCALRTVGMCSHRPGISRGRAGGMCSAARIEGARP